MAHTPGPWIVRGQYVFTEGCRTTIAGVYADGDLDLIVAAPDLLSELKDAVQTARNYATLFHDEAWQARVTKWDAAIAKAEGR